MQPFATYPSLKDRVIVISGGASGIGASIVYAFAEQQARVIFLDLQEAAAQALISRISEAGLQKPCFYLCDLSDVSAIEQIASQVLERFHTVDVLVNNAGDDTRHSITDVTVEAWDRILAVNLRHHHQHEFDRMGHPLD